MMLVPTNNIVKRIWYNYLMNKGTPQYSESIEMYLETILILSKDGKDVRQADVAKALGFSRPTVHIAIKKMAADGLIKIEDGLILLQPEARRLAESIYERHQTFTQFLVHLGVERKTAEMDACRIEHYVSEQTFQKIKQFCESGKCKEIL